MARCSLLGKRARELSSEDFPRTISSVLVFSSTVTTLQLRFTETCEAIAFLEILRLVQDE